MSHSHTLLPMSVSPHVSAQDSLYTQLPLDLKKQSFHRQRSKTEVGLSNSDDGACGRYGRLFRTQPLVFELNDMSLQQNQATLQA